MQRMVFEAQGASFVHQPPLHHPQPQRLAGINLEASAEPLVRPLPFHPTYGHLAADAESAFAFSPHVPPPPNPVLPHVHLAANCHPWTGAGATYAIPTSARHFHTLTRHGLYSQPLRQSDHRLRTNFGMDETAFFREEHASLARDLRRLEHEVRSSKSLYDTERISFASRIEDLEERAISRTVMFARIKAVKLLQSTGTELGRRIASLCEGNSIASVALKSTAADCTLEEFQKLSFRLLSDHSAPCIPYPSECHLRYPNLRDCSQLSIVFATYADICEALQLDINVRESAVYRERKNSASFLQAIQVMGTQVFQSGSRSILLGCSDHSRVRSDTLPTLFQESVSWVEDSWACDFEYRDAPIASFRSSTTLPTMATQRNGTNAALHSQHSFALQWERRDDTAGYIQGTNAIPGSLYSVFPVVVVRSTTLTRATKAIFGYPRTSANDLKNLVATGKSAQDSGVPEQVQPS